MATPYPNQLAGNGTMGGYTPFQLFAGEKEIVTAHDDVAPNTAIAQFQVLAKNAAGQLVPHAPAATDGTQNAVGVAAQPLESTASAVSLPYYVSAFFNVEALVFDETLATLEARKAAFVGTEIQIGTLYGGNW